MFGPLILHSPNETYSFSDSAASNSSSSSTSRRSASDFDAESADSGLSVRAAIESRASNRTSSSAANNTYDADLIFFVGDVYNTFSTTVLQSYLSPNGPDGTQGDEPVGDGGLVNGIGRSNCAFAPADSSCDGGSNYNFTVEANKRYRLRVVNAGSLADIRFSVDGHVMTVIEADGTPVQPVKVQSVQVSVAQRYSVIIETNQQPGACEFLFPVSFRFVLFFVPPPPPPRALNNLSCAPLAPRRLAQTISAAKS